MRPAGGYPPLMKFTCSSVPSAAESAGAKGRGLSVSDGGKYSRRVPCRTLKWSKYNNFLGIVKFLKSL